MTEQYSAGVVTLAKDLEQLMDASHVDHDASCTICTSIKAAQETSPIEAHLIELRELNETAPYGRCVLDNLALSEYDKELYGDMHANCAKDFYE